MLRHCVSLSAPGPSSGSLLCRWKLALYNGSNRVGFPPLCTCDFKTICCRKIAEVPFDIRSNNANRLEQSPLPLPVLTMMSHRVLYAGSLLCFVLYSLSVWFEFAGTLLRPTQFLLNRQWLPAHPSDVFVTRYQVGGVLDFLSSADKCFDTSQDYVLPCPSHFHLSSYLQYIFL